MEFCMNESCYGQSRIFRTLFLVLSISFFATAGGALAQRTVEVMQGFGTLNDAINADTTETGARVDSNTVYVLERGGIYLLNGSIENRFPLTIVAADGEGERPVLQPGVNDGGTSSRPVSPASRHYTARALYY